jgi:glyoxylase-like metal-dependent hydrolase (beta-lactamase superfamily II)
MADEDWAPYRALYPELFAGPEWRLPVTCTLVRHAGRAVLVDAGTGPPGWWDFWRPEAEGCLAASLEELGVQPDAVDTIFLTHFDDDHVGWLDGSTFAHARLLATREATAHVREAMARVREATSSNWLWRLIEERVELVEPGDELLPGLSIVDYPGHRPGHAGLDLVSDGQRAALIADAVGHPALLDRADWRFTYDGDVELAAQTREDLTASVVDTDTIVVCGHFPGSGIGRVRRRDGMVVWEEL